MSVGMPGWIKLDEFGSKVWDAFGGPPYHVGSSLINKNDWRDVDVRMLLSDEVWEAWGFGDPKNPNAKWISICWAFTELGRAMTGLPIDFQIQQQTYANEHFGKKEHPRSALGCVPLRYRQSTTESQVVSCGG